MGVLFSCVLRDEMIMRIGAFREAYEIVIGSNTFTTILQRMPQIIKQNPLG